MSRKSLLWQLAPYNLLILLACLTGLAAYAFHAVREVQDRQTLENLRVRAELIRPVVLDFLEAADLDGLNAELARLGREVGTRITVIRPDGSVVAESHRGPAQMENHAGRPEIARALRGEMGTAIRYSASVHRDMVYVALPLNPGEQGGAEFVLRAALPLATLAEQSGPLLSRLILAALALMALAALCTVVIVRRLGAPLRQMASATEAYARGDFTGRVPVPASQELGQLADRLNWMAAQLGEKMDTIRSQHNELEAVLSSMVEGVIAVDAEERILRINRALAQMLGLDPAWAQGRSVIEGIRNRDLQRFIQRTLRAEAPLSDEIVLGPRGPRQFQVHGMPLLDAEQRRIGVLVVLHDVTDLRRLETVRRDFVANVSHELKTPITSIKGFVETLREGGVEQPDERSRFLDIVARQADRLSSIIEDLLSLSRIEQENERGRIACSEQAIRPILLSVVELCESRAQAREIRLEVEADANLSFPVNRELMEQALINLVTNAVTYSPPGSMVSLRAQRERDQVVLEVEDQGCGIPAEHLPRIFERFYRVDKARSRAGGGTGLGLSIVKHIAQAHGGTVSVESEVGRGSRFAIEIPLQAEGAPKG